MNAREYSQWSTPEKLFKAIPKNVTENISWRKELHAFLFSDEKAKIDYLAKAFIDPRIMFNSAFFTYDPWAEAGKTNIPFILWPHQEPAVLEIKKAIDEKYDVILDKSRREGATYIVCGVFALYWLLSEGSVFLMGSRVEDLVDGAVNITKGSEPKVVGNEKSIFYKLVYLINSLPVYLQPNYTKSHMLYQNLDMGTSFTGEATSMGFGKGSRATAICVDEVAAIEPKIAQVIIENIADTAKCCIFNSTQGDWGGAHPYNKILTEGKTKVVVLDWSQNPTKNQGMYRSPKEGFVEFADVDYYKKKYPSKFEGILPNITMPVQNVVETYPFVADGGVSNFSSWRSIWYDKEANRTGRTQRGLAQNILRIPFGSSDMFFDYGLILKLQDKVKEPNYQGEIKYERNRQDELTNARFEFGGSNSSLAWWGKLENGRPNQLHNYVVGCDISKGTGKSNSVAAIFDVNTNEICGLWVNPYYTISDFAEQVVAVCEWIGGAQTPFLIWEANGASDFIKRIQELGYYSLYIKRDEKSRVQRLGNRYGWWSTGGKDGTKMDVLNELNAALNEGLRSEPRFTPCKLYDAQLIIELKSYIYFEGKVEVGPVTLQTETSGAKAAHGDRVIAVALCMLGAKNQPKSDLKRSTFIQPGSFMSRFTKVQREEEQRKKDGKIWLY